MRLKRYRNGLRNRIDNGVTLTYSYWKSLTGGVTVRISYCYAWASASIIIGLWPHLVPGLFRYTVSSLPLFPGRAIWTYDPLHNRSIPKFIPEFTPTNNISMRVELYKVIRNWYMVLPNSSEDPLYLFRVSKILVTDWTGAKITTLTAILQPSLVTT